jgi:hypothetical protein
MLGIARGTAESNTAICLRGASQKFIQRNISSSLMPSYTSTHLAYTQHKVKFIRLNKITPFIRPQVSAPFTVSMRRFTSSTISFLHTTHPNMRTNTITRSHHRGFKSSTSIPRSRAVDEFRINTRSSLAKGTSASQDGLLSDQFLNHHRYPFEYKKAVTLEDVVGNIKPLELSPELTLLKETETEGAKIIDGKRIAK